MIVIHKYSQAFGEKIPMTHQYVHVSDTPIFPHQDTTKILDCTPWLWHKGCHTGGMLSKLQELHPEYVIIPSSTDIDSLAFSDTGESKVIAYVNKDTIENAMKSYYVDVLLLEGTGILNYIQKTFKEITKPVWVSIPHSHKNVMLAAITSSSFDFVTHIISDAVYAFSSLGVIFHDRKGVLLSIGYDYFVGEETSDFIIIRAYNELIFNAWCNGMSGVSFDQFLSGVNERNSGINVL